jgi:hypothetical protein
MSLCSTNRPQFDNNRVLGASVTMQTIDSWEEGIHNFFYKNCIVNLGIGGASSKASKNSNSIER